MCEGEKTEPQYFEALIKNYSSTVREVTIEGKGRATIALVDKASDIKLDLERRNAMSFDHVWVVFDKDNFDDFNEAINKAHKLGFHSAWTNEAFELWYYLHFEYLDKALAVPPILKNLKRQSKKVWRQKLQVSERESGHLQVASTIW